MPTETEIYLFLKVWRTRNQLCEKFGWSNTESYHWLRRAEKGKFVERVCLTVDNHTNRVWFYRSKDE